MMRALAVLSIACFAGGCGGATPEPTIGYDTAGATPIDPPALHESNEVVPDDVVARAEGPVRILRLPEKTPVEPRAFIDELLTADALCVGEEHDSAPDHYGEVWLLDRAAEKARSAGLELGVGLEMFQQPFQAQLSAYQKGHLEEQRFLKESEYEKRWGYSFAFYRPLLVRAKQAGLPLIALNARSELTRAVAESGIDALDPQKTFELPALKLDDPQHRADFERRMRGHPTSPSKDRGKEPFNLERYYQAQVVWDETMAERAARWLTDHAPIRRILIVAGQAHCERPAIPARVERRGAIRVKTVLLATPSQVLNGSGFDYALIVG